MGNKLGMDLYLVAMGRKALGLYKKNGFELLAENKHELKPWGSDDLYETFLLVKHPDEA